jgi:hypothetical protein
MARPKSGGIGTRLDSLGIATWAGDHILDREGSEVRTAKFPNPIRGNFGAEVFQGFQLMILPGRPSGRHGRLRTTLIFRKNPHGY